MPQDSPSELSDPGTQRPCVLVVDDEPPLTSLVADLLPQEGYDVEVANSAAQAMEKMQTGNVSMMLTDVMMPVKNGIELAHEAIKQQPGLHIGFMTGYYEEAIENGPYRHPVLRKPFTVSQLFQFLSSLEEENN